MSEPVVPCTCDHRLSRWSLATGRCAHCGGTFDLIATDSQPIINSPRIRSAPTPCPHVAQAGESRWCRLAEASAGTLAAEVERLTGERDRLRQLLEYATQFGDETKARAERAEAELAAAREDVERVKYIERTGYTVMCWRVREPGDARPDNGWTIGSDDGPMDDIADGPTWRETVDAARQAGGEVVG
jgi:hypothetical protein